jgi:hypothetical protein
VHVDGHLQRVVARRQHREGDVSWGTWNWDVAILSRI